MRERKETLLEILSAEGLLNQEQMDLLKSKEALQRSKILKSKTPGMRQNIFDQSAVSIIDIIESLKITSPKSSGKIITDEIIMMTVAKHLMLPFLKIDSTDSAFEQYIDRCHCRPF
jgi:hypothetical protein